MNAYTDADVQDDARICCGAPMYLCTAEHTDGKRYFHCHYCSANREARADSVERP